MDDYFIVDIETCPINLENHENLEEEEKIKLINPIDSRIIAIGIRYKGENKIFLGENEKDILEKFWSEWKSIKDSSGSAVVVGFNINSFDLPFITTRSLINNVKISPFTIKSVIDLREKISAYRRGKTRGKLKEYASLMGLPVGEIDGSDVAGLCAKKDYDSLKTYLISDLNITDELFKRARETRIIEISKW